MRYLIFEYQFEGHYLEYIRHLLSYAKVNRPKDDIYICIPRKYSKYVAGGDLPNCERFHFRYLSDEDLKIFKESSKLSLLTHSNRRCMRISDLVRQYDIDCVILITLLPFLFGIRFTIPSNVSVCGIEYIIPRHRKNIGFAKRLEDKFRMWLYTNTPQLKKVFLLNDEESAAYYNEKYQTSKFKFLPDPIDCKTNCENTINTPANKITLLHAGCFRKEKGTFDIIGALNLLKPEEREPFKFILSGKSLVESDNELAKEEIRKLSRIMDVEFYNSFVDESFLHNLYLRADYVLMPYHNYFQSSGNLGHAASYGKPVIGPSQGLLGNLIRKYELGYTVNTLDANGIVDVLRQILDNPKKFDSLDMYTQRCSPDAFAKAMFASSF